MQAKSRIESLDDSSSVAREHLSSVFFPRNQGAHVHMHITVKSYWCLPAGTFLLQGHSHTYKCEVNSLPSGNFGFSPVPSSCMSRLGKPRVTMTRSPLTDVAAPTPWQTAQ